MRAWNGEHRSAGTPQLGAAIKSTPARSTRIGIEVKNSPATTSTANQKSIYCTDRERLGAQRASSFKKLRELGGLKRSDERNPRAETAEAAGSSQACTACQALLDSHRGRAHQLDQEVPAVPHLHASVGDGCRARHRVPHVAGGGTTNGPAATRRAPRARSAEGSRWRGPALPSSAPAGPCPRGSSARSRRPAR